MKYTVKYRPSNQLLWRKLKNVTGDGISEAKTGFRWFYLEDNTYVEIPTSGVIFRFSKERYSLIKAKMEKEAGQRLPTST